MLYSSNKYAVCQLYLHLVDKATIKSKQIVLSQLDINMQKNETVPLLHTIYKY